MVSWSTLQYIQTIFLKVTTCYNTDRKRLSILMNLAPELLGVLGQDYSRRSVLVQMLGSLYFGTHLWYPLAQDVSQGGLGKWGKPYRT